MFDISPIHLIVVLGIALLVFGPKRLPEMGRSIGRGIRDFKEGLSGDDPATTTAAASPAGTTLVAGTAHEAEPTPEAVLAGAATPVPAEGAAERPVAAPRA